MTLRERMNALLEALEEARYSDRPGVRLPKAGVPERALKHFKAAGETQKTMMRVARAAKEKYPDRPDVAALAVKKAREASRELAGHREASRQRREAAIAKEGALARLKRVGSKVRSKILKFTQGAKRAA